MVGESDSGYTYSYGKRPLWQWILLYIIIGAAVYGLLYYFVFAKNGGYQAGQYQAPTSVPQATAQPSSSTAATQQFTIEGNEFAFTPSTITVKAGQEVKITFKNTGKFPHNLTLSDLDVQTKTIQPGEEDTITFTPSKTGSFAYECTVDSHTEKGMKGTLTVQ